LTLALLFGREVDALRVPVKHKNNMEPTAPGDPINDAQLYTKNLQNPGEQRPGTLPETVDQVDLAQTDSKSKVNQDEDVVTSDDVKAGADAQITESSKMT